MPKPKLAMAWSSKVRANRGAAARYGGRGSCPTDGRTFSAHAQTILWAARRPGRRRRLGRARPAPRRDRSAPPGSSSPPSAPTSSPTASTAASSPTASSGSTTGGPPPPSGSPTAATSSRPRAGCSSATTSRPSPAPARWSGPVLAAQFGYLPGHDLDRVRRGARRRGAGLHHPVRLDAPRRQVARPDGQGGDRPGHRHARHGRRCSRSWSSCSRCSRWSWSTRSRTAPGASSPSSAPSRSRC